MPESVVGRTLHARRRSLIGWSFGVAEPTVITAAFYPFVAQEPAIRDLMEQLPEAVLAATGAAGADLVSSAGYYLDARLFGLIAPLLFLIFAIGWATRMLAVEEEEDDQRGLATGVSAAIGVAAYPVDPFAPIVDGLERVQPASLFYLNRGNQPLRNGLDGVHALALPVFTAAMLGVAVWTFERRDIGT